MSKLHDDKFYLPEWKPARKTPLSTKIRNFCIYDNLPGQRKANGRDYTVLWFCVFLAIWTMARMVAA